MVTSSTEIQTPAALLRDVDELRAQVQLIVNSTHVTDLHTHVFPPEFNSLYLYGIDELLTYHYLIAETFRSTRVSYQQYWRLSKTEQADLVWQTLFVENTPTSEAARGVISVLDAFGLDTRAPYLREAREFFNSRNAREHVAQVFEMALVSDLVMTNDPLDEKEQQTWKLGVETDRRFRSSLRLDGFLNNWEERGVRAVHDQGWPVNRELDQQTITALRHCIDGWVKLIKPIYFAVSLPAEFQFPHNDTRDRLLREVVLPSAKEHALPLTLMVGVRRRVNPKLREAGDGVGRADVTAVERLCGEYGDVKFLATFLSRENQHELCVAARKFANLMPFGCWWFLNNPSIVSEITTERFELLGPSFIPQHSDARVLEQLIYKWRHARKEIADVLCKSYEQLLDSGRAVTAEEISRDVRRLFSGNFDSWIRGE